MVVKRPEFLTKPYSAYYHREVPDEDSFITHVGPGTPAGEYLRRFWQPVIVSHQLREFPLAIKRLGEALVAFRDGSGRAGLLQLYCSHCGASLESGQIEEDGIRCRRNGWKFAADGRALDTPGAPSDNALRDRFCHGSYPVTEHGGVVFAYMGPPEKMPDFPAFDVYETPGYHFEPGRHLMPSPEGLVPNLKPCNWVQCVDNLADPQHEEFLHATISGIQFTDMNGRLLEEVAIKGEGKYLETPTSIITLDMRRVNDDTVWVRNIEFLWPNMAALGGPPVFPHEWGPGETEDHILPVCFLWAVPVDDYNTVEIDIVRVPDGQRFQRSKLKMTALEANMGRRDYEQMQRIPGDYEAQISQRTIAVHALEHLGASDRGVTLLRKGVRRGIRAVQQGQDPPELEHLSGEMAITYGGDTLLRLDKAATPEEDRELIGRKGLDLAKRYVESPPNVSVPASS